MNRPLAGRRAIVTGGTRGIGRAIATRLLAEGASVLVTGTGPSGTAPEGCDYVAVDFADSVATERFATEIGAMTPDILVNNAGINVVADFAAISMADFGRMHRVNLLAPMLLCRAVVPGMRTRRWGRIVNISSIWGKIARGGRAGYAATKFGIDGMTAALAAEVAADGVLANCVAPGFIDTELTRHNLGEEGIRVWWPRFLSGASARRRRWRRWSPGSSGPKIPMSAAKTSPSTAASPGYERMPPGDLVIRSHKGPYRVRFVDEPADAVVCAKPSACHFLIDERVAQMHGTALAPVVQAPSVLKLEATEDAKTLDRFPAYVAHLVDKGLRRDHQLIAIGGGIIQDITCFLAATMLRGVAWSFVPTTLLAQADSCIGSKSSINAGSAKNILGTVTSPTEATICVSFLDTLDERDVRSGIGEILKAHAIDGPSAFDRVARDYDLLLTDRAVLSRYIRAALEIKKRFIEIDEFDRGPRNVFNYGHSFGMPSKRLRNSAFRTALRSRSAWIWRISSRCVAMASKAPSSACMRRCG